jgi:hypothetical protein
MLLRVAIVRTDVSEEHFATVIRVTRIGELETLAVTINLNTLQGNTSSSGTLVLARATRCNIPEGGLLHEECWSQRVMCMYSDVTVSSVFASCA